MKKKSLLAAALGAVVMVSAYTTGPASLIADAAETAVPADLAAIQQAPAIPYSIIVNGKELSLDSPARLSGSTMLVPARNIAEALGAVVSYEEATQTIIAVKDEITVTFQIGSASAQKNGSPYTLETAPVKDNGVTMVPVRFFSETFGTVVRWDSTLNRVHIDYESSLLPSVGSSDRLKELLRKSDNAMYGYNYSIMKASAPFAGAAVTESGAAMDVSTAASAPSAPATGSASDAASDDYSATNVQVQGVDEADVVKTDGQYIYQVNRDRIMITRAYPAGEMSLVATLPLGEQKLQPLELYVDGNRMTVISAYYPDFGPVDGGGIKPTDDIDSKKMAILPVRNPMVKTIVYDISSKETPTAVKEVETEGQYITSRKIGGDLYVISNQYVNRYHILNEAADAATPQYRDSTVSKDYERVSFQDIRYFPDSFMDSYMLVTGINTALPERKASVSVYLGSAQNVYASARNLYVSVTQNKLVPAVTQDEASGTSQPVQDTAIIRNEINSVVYKFLMADGEVRYTAKGEVPGTILNQFSMDEHNGYFRIATTKGDMWSTGENISKNNLYVLDESMRITGQIEDIAPGERIYSVRFMGGRGYMVTFKKVDPLFVLDLADPSNPTILGKLKIPGYSDYLHPYDETHLIGFGKDAEEAVNEWEVEQGISSPSTTAYYQGMKIAMFDVSDVSNPVEMFKAEIGDRGTDSELLRNHKALLFSKEKNLLAFPVTVMKVTPEARQEQGAMAYGQFAFQGAYVYGVDLENGFTLRGSITHLSEQEMLKAGSEWYDSSRNVERVLYIGDTLYTLSQSQIRANDLATLEEKGSVMMP